MPSPSYIFRMKRLQGFLPVPRSSVSRHQIHRHRREAPSLLSPTLALILFGYGGVHVRSIGVMTEAIEDLLAGA